MKDATRLLDEAVSKARDMGLDCEGWTLQSGQDGYVAWLYRIDDEYRQLPLSDEVEVRTTALGAARWCMREIDPEAAPPSDE